MKQRSFLKWAGSKYSCLQHILPHFTKSKRLIEPFLGSGTVFLNTQYKEYLLAEKNIDLINLYTYIQKDHELFINFCQQYFCTANNDKKKYYDLRDEFNSLSHGKKRAALFLYLNRHGYNGLCRYNSKGGYNVPFGRHLKPSFPINNIKYFSLKSQNATFINSDFRDTFEHATKGDLIYCDPPYAPLQQDSNFSEYTGQNFNVDDHIDLASLARNSADKGARVIISNHDTKFTRELYADACIQSFSVHRHISRDVGNRQAVQEIIAIYDGY